MSRAAVALLLCLTFACAADPFFGVRICWSTCGLDCSGFAIEAALSVFALKLILPSAVVLLISPRPLCRQLPAYILRVIDAVTVATSGDCDVVIQHCTPPQYAPRRSGFGDGAVVIGRSMTECTRISDEWAKRIAADVDELWLTSHAQIAPFVAAGVDPARIAVVPQPIDVATAMTRPHTAPIRIAPREQHAFAFLSISKFEPRKGFALLINAFTEEFTAADNATLLISTYRYIGAQPRNAHLIKRDIINSITALTGTAPTASALSRVHIIADELSADDLARLYRTADAFVLCTAGEGFGRTILEAMAHALPVAVSRIDSAGYMDVVNQYNAILIPTHGSVPAMGHDFDAKQKYAKLNATDVRSAMRALFTRRNESKRLAMRAQSDVVRRLNVRTIAQAMRARLLVIMRGRAKNKM